MWTEPSDASCLQNRLLEVAELGARFEPQLVAHEAAEHAERCEGVGLPTRAVEGEHELSAEAFVKRMEPYERLELADCVGLASQGDHGLEASLERLQAKTFESCDLRLCERLAREVGERRPTPELERACEQRLRLVW